VTTILPRTWPPSLASCAAGLRAHLAAGADQAWVTALGGDLVGTLRAVAGAMAGPGADPAR
jgi:hypothetical protein